MLRSLLNSDQVSSRRDVANVSNILTNAKLLNLFKVNLVTSLRDVAKLNPVAKCTDRLENSRNSYFSL
jgi:hypothetical protein